MLLLEMHISHGHGRAPKAFEVCRLWHCQILLQGTPTPGLEMGTQRGMHEKPTKLASGRVRAGSSVQLGRGLQRLQRLEIKET